MWYEVSKNSIYKLFFGINMVSMSIIQVLVDSAVSSAHGVLIWSEIGVKPASLFEIENVYWWIAIREHLFKKK
jgi:hypothetical protein